MEKLYSEIIVKISKKEKELHELSTKLNKNIHDMIDEEYIKGELSSLNEILNMITKS